MHCAGGTHASKREISICDIIITMYFVAGVSAEVSVLTQLALVQSSCASSLSPPPSEPLVAQLTELTS